MWSRVGDSDFKNDSEGGRWAIENFLVKFKQMKGADARAWYIMMV